MDIVPLFTIPLILAIYIHMCYVNTHIIYIYVQFFCFDDHCIFCEVYVLNHVLPYERLHYWNIFSPFDVIRCVRHFSFIVIFSLCMCMHMYIYVCNIM